MRERLQLTRTKVIVFGVALAAIAAGVAIAAPAFGPTKSEHWGGIPRNTIGSPVEDLRQGPASISSTGDVSEPPFGKGSLGLEVADKSTSLAAPQEKASFGNEVDFFGDPLLSVTAVGFNVFQTGENVSYGGASNLPGITFEIDPNLGSTPSNFSSFVWVPGPYAGPVNQWSPYIDATTNGGWVLSGAAGTATGCILATPCTFANAMTALNDGGDAPTILSLAVTKGRDTMWIGAVDGLRLNDKIYDFETDGVKEKPAPR